MSLTTHLPSPDLVGALASLWFGGGLSPVWIAHPALIATPRDVRAGSELDEWRHAVHAQIVPPTSQNQGAIEADLAALAPSVLDLPQTEAVHRLEMLIRAYDPCISRATHFLDLRIVEDGA